MKATSNWRQVYWLVARTLALGCLVSAWTPPATAQQAGPAGGAIIELRAGSTTPKGDPLADATDKFVELVNSKAKGELIVRHFYQALGVEHQLTQSVMAGSVDMGSISQGNAGRYTDAWLMFDLPFLFKKEENFFRFLEGPVGRRVIERFENDLGVKLLFVRSYSSGRGIQTRSKALRTPADIKGLKIRVVSTPIDLITFRTWGANPTPVDFGQLYTALQQGVVDGSQISVPAILSGKFNEILKHEIRLDYQLGLELYFMNGKKFASLLPRHQQILLEAAKEAEAWHRKDAAARMAGVLRELEKSGMEIYTPKPDEYAQWASIRERVWQQVGEQLAGKIDMKLAQEIYQSQ
jgi:tripartite ATP-independent transporter DctP family solute receptor